MGSSKVQARRTQAHKRGWRFVNQQFQPVLTAHGRLRIRLVQRPERRGLDRVGLAIKSGPVFGLFSDTCHWQYEWTRPHSHLQRRLDTASDN